MQSYIVYLGVHDAPEINLPDAELHQRRAHSHHRFLSSFLGGRSVCLRFNYIYFENIYIYMGFNWCPFWTHHILISHIIICTSCADPHSFCSLDKAREAIFYSYNKHINGFAALLEENLVTQMASTLLFCRFLFIFA